jgi:hypothetical protein
MIGVLVPGPCLRFTVVLTTPGAAEAQTGNNAMSAAKTAGRASAKADFMAHLSQNRNTRSKAENCRKCNRLAAGFATQCCSFSSSGNGA